jgi:uncharacterized protein (TIGR00251 family)
MFYSIKDDLIRLKIKAQPQSNKNSFCGILGDALKIKIKAPAVEGAANKELVKFISKSFKVPKTQIKILSGTTGKIKVLEFPKSEKFFEFIKGLEEKNG